MPEQVGGSVKLILIDVAAVDRPFPIQRQSYLVCIWKSCTLPKSAGHTTAQYQAVVGTISRGHVGKSEQGDRIRDFGTPDQMQQVVRFFTGAQSVGHLQKEMVRCGPFDQRPIADHCIRKFVPCRWR